MKTINVSLIKQEDFSYSIYIDQGILARLSDYLSRLSQRSKYLIVTDSNVKELYGTNVLESMIDSGFETYLFSFPAGEEQKNIDTKIDIESYMFQNKFGRDSVIIALGGGVVGDLSGFTASTFNRGIPYVQIPTTILAQVDSSVGGKTGIDVPYGKNLIGTFYQPKMVIIDPLVLKSLPNEEYIAGMAEVIKHAIIQDESLFKLLYDQSDAIMSRDMDVLERIIEWNCDIKRRVVEEDEKEGNLRRILNYGHTIGHAIETLMDYQSLHGECVAIGMLVEAEIASILGYLDAFCVKDIEKLVSKFSLPTHVPIELSEEAIYQTTLLDKKAVRNEPFYSLPKDIGTMLELEGQYGVQIDSSIVYEGIRKYKRP